MKYQTLCYGFGLGARFASPETALARLEEEVNNGIGCGWIPLGGVGISLNGGQGIVFQAMTLAERGTDSEGR